MKNYYRTETINASKTIWDESSNKLYNEDIKIKKKIDITKEVKDTFIHYSIWIIILTFLTILSWILWIVCGKARTENAMFLPIIFSIISPFIIIYSISGIVNASQGYVDIGSYNHILENYFKEELENLEKENQKTIEIANNWRLKHPFEEKCRLLIEEGNANMLAEFIKPLVEIYLEDQPKKS